ncbi:MAG: uracil-DNA glycosylase [Hyphomicrobiaceae bacterium]|nr:uracil-DNA glycosylase [Hyphomicrobiaceae bacterium]
MMDDNGTDRLLALLSWWREAGVDVAYEEVATDWLARGDKGPGADYVWPAKVGSAEATAEISPSRLDPPSPAPASATAEPRQRLAVPPPPFMPGAQRGHEPAARPPSGRLTTGPAAAGREAARSAGTLDELRAMLADFEGCALKATAKSLCFYRGSPTARLMVIGEAPGRDEDLAGKPFVGRAGQLLDRMLAAIGLAEPDVHITNIVYWRPPGNRTPTPEEAAACRPFLERQIELVAPELILTLGGPAAKAILGVADGITKLRGKWREIVIGGRNVRVMPTLHPAYLLRQPDAKRYAWRDLLAVRMALGDTAKA